jgi:hypothetical protein
MLAEVSASTLKFHDRNVPPDMASTYILVAVNAEGREGDPAVATVN